MENKEPEVNTSHSEELDLGTCGGGRVPKKGSSTDGMDETAERGSNADAGFHSSSGTSTSPAIDNATHMPVGGNLGGRSPGQQGAELGDRDRPRERDEDNDATVDPMTSRAPDKVNES